MADKISIIIPIYNEANQIAKTIQHLRDNEFGWIGEIIVCDSAGSNDGLTLEEDSGLVLHKCVGKGRAVQMNEGARLAKYEVLLFCHADVKPPHHFDQCIMDEIAAGKQMGIFAYDFEPSNFWLEINAGPNKRDGIFTGGGDQCHFIEKDVFNKLGGYDEKFVIMEDFDLFRRVKNMKIPYGIIQKKAKVSSRKYEKNSYVRVNLVNLMAFMMFLSGVSPQVIKNFCSRFIKT